VGRVSPWGKTPMVTGCHVTENYLFIALRHPP
jgi:hypothetical protein